MSAAYLAIDWGSTHRRSWAVTSDGRVIDHSRDACGIKALKPGEYPGSVADLRRQFGELPVLAAGMVGSANGWAEAPYVAAPAGLDALAARLLTLDGDVRIVPGLRTADTDPPDVMRGEEVPLLGAVVAGLIPPEAQVLKPGTHSKFAVLADGRITRFRTAMTGEVFALLKEHSLLAAMLQAEIADGPAFREGVREGRDRDLLSALFGVRASVLLGRRSTADGAAFASGLLIGDELAARPLSGRTYLLAASPQRELYAAALAELGHTAAPVDADEAFLAGIHALWSLSR